jgi:hypothetical protein
MRVIKGIVGLALLALAGCATVEQLPWATTDSMVENVTNVMPMFCPDSEGLFAQLNRNGVDYAYFTLNSPQQHFLVVQYTPEGDASKLYFGHVDGDKIVVDKVEAYDAGKHGKNACDVPWLAASGA